MCGSTPHWEWLPDSSMIKIIPNGAVVDVACDSTSACRGKTAHESAMKDRHE
jgi:hypothetical protein